MRTLITVVVVLAVLCLLAVITAFSGWPDVAATSKHNPMVRWFLSTTSEHSIAAHAKGLVPPVDYGSAAQVGMGLRVYADDCVICHGAPGIEPSDLGKGLLPHPPDLHHLDEPQEHTPERTFWVVKHGIKMTGMPAFGPTHSDAELWAVTAFVQALPNMSAEEYANRARREGVSPGPPAELEE
jgi:mono/diheme cytochrome c family protein